MVSRARAHADAIAVALIFALLWGASLAWNAHTQAEQQRQGRIIERKICIDVSTMAAIQPPAGNAAANPSRAYEQAEHRAWAGLVSGIGC